MIKIMSASDSYVWFNTLEIKKYFNMIPFVKLSVTLTLNWYFNLQMNTWVFCFKTFQKTI